ncbi:MAG: RNase adaptor protein RapZ [Rhodobacterales bacterium]|nr:RNase adaptor protein RapZ [Rhodobacterales bacterium]
MGYKNLQVNPKAWEISLSLDEAVAIVERLEPLAQERGLQIGVKFSNTLELVNKEKYFSDETMYMSGPPLHTIAVTLVEEWRKRVGNRFPITFAAGIDREIDLLAPIRVRADHLIDTSDMSPHDLKAEIARWFGHAGGARMAVSVQSFSYKRGIPRGVDMVFDCRFLDNPHWVPALRDLDGRDPAVASHVMADPQFAPFFDRIADLVLFLLPAQLDEGKAHLAIAFGCTGGQHRSVTVAERLGDRLAEAGWAVSKRHRELERRAAAAPGTGGMSGA